MKIVGMAQNYTAYGDSAKGVIAKISG